MQIERKVRTVNRAVAFEQLSNLFVGRPGNRHEGIPKHAVVDDQEIDPAFHREFERTQTRVDRRADLADLAPVGELQSVARAWKVGDLRDADALVAPRYNIIEFGHDVLESM